MLYNTITNELLDISELEQLKKELLNNKFKKKSDIKELLDSVNVRYKPIYRKNRNDKLIGFEFSKNTIIENLEKTVKDLIKLIDATISRDGMKLLFCHLTLQWQYEKFNSQVYFTRKRFLELFYEIINSVSCQMNKMTVLNFFTISQVNMVKIIFKKKLFDYFLNYFTIENFQKDKIYNRKINRYVYPTIDNFINILKKKRYKIYIQNKNLKKNYLRIIKSVIKKLNVIKKIGSKKKKISKDELFRKMVEKENLRPYFLWSKIVGSKFSNRVEKDYSNFFIMKSIQENSIRKEKKRSDLKEEEE